MKLISSVTFFEKNSMNVMEAAHVLKPSDVSKRKVRSLDLQIAKDSKKQKRRLINRIHNFEQEVLLYRFASTWWL